MLEIRDVIDTLILTWLPVLAPLLLTHRNLRFVLELELLEAKPQSVQVRPGDLLSSCTGRQSVRPVTPCWHTLPPSLPPLSPAHFLVLEEEGKGRGQSII